jgi:mannose-6-phosphate isomerase-like protein (cupin superfamily)
VNLVSPRDGEILDEDTSRIRILEAGGMTSGRLGMAELWLAPGFSGPPQHLHRRHDETFFVLSGTVGFTSGSTVLTATRGFLAVVPIGTPHTFTNLGKDADATILFTTTPDLYIGYFRDLAALHARYDNPNRQQILEIMKRYATEEYLPGG